jgi:hypothetical protein
MSPCQVYSAFAMLDSQRKFNIAHNSSTDIARLSIPARRAELFLERLANLDATDEKKVVVFAERFSDLLPTRTKIGAREPDKFSRTFSFLRSLLANQIQPQLRIIWREPAPLAKEAGLMMLGAAYMKGCSRQEWAEISAFPPGVLRTLQALGVPSGADGFLMVLLYALKHVHLLRYCGNADCKEPYFVAKRASQVFCGGPCAGPAQREAKKRWWDEHGEARRKKRRKNEEVKHAKAKKA